MTTAELTLYELLKSKLRLNEHEAKDFISTFHAAAKQNVTDVFDERKRDFATKEDPQNVKDSISELKIEMERNQKEMFKWMFAHTFVIIATIVAILKLL